MGKGSTEQERNDDRSRGMNPEDEHGQANEANHQEQLERRDENHDEDN